MLLILQRRFSFVTSPKIYIQGQNVFIRCAVMVFCPPPSLFFWVLGENVVLLTVGSKIAWQNLSTSPITCISSAVFTDKESSVFMLLKKTEHNVFLKVSQGYFSDNST